MVILNANGDLIVSPNYDLGHVEIKSSPITHTYIIDVKEQGHWETIAEYPETGGTDIEWRIDVPEVGHWETRDDSGEIVKHYDGLIPDDLPKEQPVDDIWQYGLYIEYTQDELDKIAHDKAEADKIATESERRFKSMEEQILNVQLALTELYETGVK